MTHAYHDALPGYHPDQILHEGCIECERRGKDPVVALNYLDADNFRRAWRRAADFRASSPPSGREAEHIANIEVPLLDLLWAVQLRLHKIFPLGTLPEGTL